MTDSELLKNKALKAIQKEDFMENEDIKKHKLKEREFLYEYFICGNAGKAYKKIYGHPNNRYCSYQASRILKRLNVSFSEILEVSGHGIRDLFDALERVKKDNPSDYVKFMLKMHKLESPETQINIQNNIIPPTINIIGNEQFLYSDTDTKLISQDEQI